CRGFTKLGMAMSHEKLKGKYEVLQGKHDKLLEKHDKLLEKHDGLYSRHQEKKKEHEAQVLSFHQEKKDWLSLKDLMTQKIKDQKDKTLQQYKGFGSSKY
ncbi:hypothetical protein Tco_0354158, partial [Tanacetum coccineum]